MDSTGSRRESNGSPFRFQSIPRWLNPSFSMRRPVCVKWAAILITFLRNVPEVHFVSECFSIIFIVYKIGREIQ
jgi:hypothetical protein